MVALLLALKQVLQGNHFSVMQDEKVALLQRLFLRKYNTQECEGTSYVPRTSGRYILEETAWKTTENWFSRSIRFVKKETTAIKHVDQNNDSDAVTNAFNV